MRASRLNITTLREDPSDAETASHRLLLRGGFICKSGAGLYLYGPLLQRTLEKVRRIVSDEISSAGGLEITMPIMQERALWEASGRWATYQASRTMLTVKDRGGQEYGLAPTAEEVVTDYAAKVVQSYKQLPVCFFQQHTKFRDEIRPRFGLMRVKEFIMMDAYSFHDSEASLAETYQAMNEAYHRAFGRCGLEAFAVEADAGAIGGSGSHEFMVAAAVGEDAILYCPESGYAANVERAEGAIPAAPAWAEPAKPHLANTPGHSSIDALVQSLRGRYPDLSAAHCLKCVLFVATVGTAAKAVPIAAFVRGDRQVNTVKLTNALSRRFKSPGAVTDLRAMRDDEIDGLTGSAVGFTGPGFRAPELVAASVSEDGPRRQLSEKVVVVCDERLRDARGLVVGANVPDWHVVGYSVPEHAPASMYFDDITTIVPGDACPRSGLPLHEKRGIEVGHIFKLGTKYSAAMGATFMAKDGTRQPFIMGCYGIGTSRVVASAVEQHHDQDGICWPMAIAPYQCVIVPTKSGDAAADAVTEALYRELLAAGIEVVLDDRDLKPGPKFKDWDLIGLPLRVVVGRGVATGTVEFKERRSAAVDVPIAEAAARVIAAVRT